ncbi:MAG: hypothetical protein LBH52_04300 [Puniceicoccales bacterium]|jgi:hypothetical protein|nr:hypothetical protein [Puniceicoccales bacterium]
MKQFLLFLLLSYNLMPVSYGSPKCFAVLSQWIGNIYNKFWPAEEIVLDNAIKSYLEDYISQSEHIQFSSIVDSIDLQKLPDIQFSNLYSVECLRLNKVEMELLLYKFYQNNTCPKEKQTLYFLAQCLSCYIRLKEYENPWAPILRRISAEQKRILSMARSM